LTCVAWVPCPFELDPILLEEESPLDVVDLYLDEPPQNVRLKTPIRFDYDIERAEPGHPAAHMSINASDCRIACMAPLRLGHFIDFVFRNFYPDVWGTHRYLRRLSKKTWWSRTLTDEERTLPHIGWQL
jgi:hypothetical protein